MRGDNTKRYRVLKRAVIKLLKWQPEAVQIRFEGRCHCRSLWLMSYRLPTLENLEHDPDMETAGFYCPSCGFGNAGSRPKRLRRDDLETDEKSR